jgi:hypothetical protein
MRPLPKTIVSAQGVGFVACSSVSGEIVLFAQQNKIKLKIADIGTQKDDEGEMR